MPRIGHRWAGARRRPTVRTAVAANPRTPTPLLERLATEQANEVLAALACNPHTPSAVLDALVTERRALVAHLRRNPRAPIHLRDLTRPQSDFEADD